MEEVQKLPAQPEHVERPVEVATQPEAVDQLEHNLSAVADLADQLKNTPDTPASQETLAAFDTTLKGIDAAKLNLKTQTLADITAITGEQLAA